MLGKGPIVETVRKKLNVRQEEHGLETLGETVEFLITVGKVSLIV